MQNTDSGGFSKRTLLAFVLMILVWVVYTQIMPRPERPDPSTAPEGVVQETGSPGRDVGEVPLPQDAATEEPRPTSGQTPTGSPQERAAMSATYGPGTQDLHNTLPAEERLITVSGEQHRAIFSTRGGVLQSWQLAGYTDAEDRPVELVQDLPGALGLSIERPQGTLDLTHTIFAVEETWEPASPAAEPVRVLRFTAEVVVDGAETPLRVERIFRIDPTSYLMSMELSISGVSNYRKDHQLAVSWQRGIPSLERQAKLERGGKAAIALLAENLVTDGYGRGHMGCGCGAGPAAEGGERPYGGMLRWCGVKGKYFSGILIPEEEVEATFIACSEPTRDEAGMRLVLPLEYEGTSRYRFMVYVGPIDYRLLKEVDQLVERDLTRLVDFGAKLIAPISKAIYWFLVKAYSVIPNYGIGIILMTILMRLIFHPLNVRALRSQRKMQALKPLLDEINATYKDNPEQRTKKMMELHKKHGVSPLGGCLPLLPQMPVFYALWSVLPNAIELRKAPFALWMRDLASPDTVGRVMGIPINILPLLMGLTMLWQQKMTPTDPKQAPMMMLMPIMMVFFFYSMPSGFLLYWTVTNLVMIGQQALMKPVVLAQTDVEAPAEQVGQTKKQRRRGKR
jgi:YidC/Oxa1 family membrane protein insertase